jgi:hypothetical protein
LMGGRSGSSIWTSSGPDGGRMLSRMPGHQGRHAHRSWDIGWSHGLRESRLDIFQRSWAEPSLPRSVPTCTRLADLGSSSRFCKDELGNRGQKRRSVGRLHLYSTSLFLL